MNLQEYQKLTTRTRAKLENKHLDVCHMILGMTGEWLTELDVSYGSEEWYEEHGDLMWYVSELANLFDIKLQILQLPYEKYEVDITESIGKIAEAYKKHMAYGKPLNMSFIESHLNNIVWCVYDSVTEIEDGVNEELFYNCLAENIAKLQERYPEKFTEEDALSRKDKLR